MTPHEEMTRANEAKRLLEHPILREAWESYERALLEVLANANTQPEKAAEVRGWLIGARKARGHLERIVKEGKLAAVEIEREASARKQGFAGRFFRVA